MIDLIERFEADQKAREDWVREDATEKERIKAIKNMIDFDIPLEKIAATYDMTVEQVKELLQESSH